MMSVDNSFAKDFRVGPQDMGRSKASEGTEPEGTPRLQRLRGIGAEGKEAEVDNEETSARRGSG